MRVLKCWSRLGARDTYTLVKEMNSRVVIKKARGDVNELLDRAIYLARQQPLEANPNDVTRSAAGGSQEDHVRET